MREHAGDAWGAGLRVVVFPRPDLPDLKGRPADGLARRIGENLISNPVGFAFRRIITPSDFQHSLNLQRSRHGARLALSVAVRAFLIRVLDGPRDWACPPVCWTT